MMLKFFTKKELPNETLLVECINVRFNAFMGTFIQRMDLDPKEALKVAYQILDEACISQK